MSSSPLVDERPPAQIAPLHRPRSRPWLTLTVLLMLIALGFTSLMRPPAGDAATPLSEFSAARARTHVDRIAVDPHPMGSSALRLVEAYITGQLNGMGLSPEVQPVEVPDYFGPPGELTTARNIIATIPGTAPTESIALVAHYDTHPASPGANDNGVGVAVLLEAARAVLAGERPTNDIVLLFTDGEEPNPRFGATAFAEFHPAFGEAGLVVNLEAIGSSGPSLLVETSEPDTGVADRYREAAANPTAFSFLPETVDLFGGVGTDFDVFKENDVPGLSFAYLRGSSIYHTDRDEPASVAIASVQHHGDNVMAAIEAFGWSPLPPAGDGVDAVYFALSPFASIGYSSFLAAMLALAGLGAFTAVIWIRLRSGRDSVAAIGRGALVLIVGSASAAIAVFVLWWLLTTVRTTPGVWESYLYLALLSVVGAVVLSVVGGAVAGRFSDAELASGIVAVWLGLAVVTTFTLPGFSYLFIWPALGGVAALAGSLSGRVRGWLWLAVTAPAVVLAIPALDAFFQMAQPRPGNPDSDLTVAVTVVGLLVALIVGLVVPFMPRHR